jgi:hypothetical protein
MKIPNNLDVFELQSSTIWFDENGILCSIAKKVPSHTVEEAKKSLVELVKITNGQKVCMLSDSTNAASANKDVRDYVATVLPDVVKAVAIISQSALGKMAANLFFSIKKQPYPVKIFNEETEAKEWLKQYL